jgi:hypothetical protein
MNVGLSHGLATSRVLCRAPSPFNRVWGAAGLLPNSFGSTPAPLNNQHSKPNKSEANSVAGLAVLHVKPRQLSTTDILALVTMKNAAKCDT